MPSPRPLVNRTSSLHAFPSARSVARLVRQTIALIAVGWVALFAVSATAADKKVDPSGTWTWTFTLSNGDIVEPKLDLKFEGDKLAGKISARGEEAPVEGAKLAGHEISFEIHRDQNGERRPIKFHGKIEGDTIKGTTEYERSNGETARLEWNATRQGGAKAGKVNVNGTWRYSFTTPNGQTVEPVLKLKQDGAKVAGAITVNETEVPISDGALKDNEISFKVIRERDGRTMTSSYKGKVEGDTIKGSVTFTRGGGEERTFELDAKRVKE